MNPQPGQVGSLGPNTLRGPSFFDLDMNLVKRIRITENRSFEFRLDAINILNHPNFANPQTSINNTPSSTGGAFGQITGLVTSLVGNGMRAFIINTRVNF
jgi:hypothetical protein